MNPDGTEDVNLISYTGPQWNDAHVDTRGSALSRITPYTAALKLTTQLHNFMGDFGTVYAGSENVADINDRSWVRLTAEKWVLTGSKYGFTVKGESYAELHGLVDGFGKECDVDFGNYSDQWPRGKSRGLLNLRREDRSPIRVRCLQAEMPQIADGSGPYIFLQPKPDAWWHDLFIEWFLFARRNRLAFT